MPEWLTSDDQTNEALLIVEAGRAIRRDFDCRARDIGLTRAQWQVLGNLRRNPGVNQKELAEMLDVQPITLTRLIDRLQKTGWVVRKPDKRDRRMHRLYLTAQVGGVVRQMQELALELRRDSLHGFTRREHATLLTLLNKLNSNICRSCTAERKKDA
ncbi:MAG: MarR family transcriptional regulator [Alphaproteobacteria bacterium]